MSSFLQAYERMIANEGGYKLSSVANDRGGQTYAGISRNNWPNWAGWKDIDEGLTPASELVRAFYKQNFWFAISGDYIDAQSIASNLFDFAVNAGPKTAIKLAQIVVGVTPDGVVGNKTLFAINNIDRSMFVALYALAKIARYRDIVTKDKSQAKFLLGWINRTLREAT